MASGLVENREVWRQSGGSGARPQQVETERVECLHRDTVSARAQQLGEALVQLGCCLAREGDGGDLRRRGSAGAHQARNPFHQGARLAGARASHNEQRPLAVGDGCFLFTIGIGGRVRRNFFTWRTDGRLCLWLLGRSNGRSAKGEGRLREQTQALFFVEHAHHAVLAVIAGLPFHLARAHAAQGLGQQGRPLAAQVFQGRIAKHSQLGPNPRHQLLARARHALAARSHAQHFAHNLDQWHQAGKRLGAFRPKTFWSVSQRRHPAEHAAGKRLSATRAYFVARGSLVGRHHHLALAVAIGVVLALLGKELERAEKTGPALAKRVAHGKVGEIAVEQIGFATQLVRGMGIGAGDERIAIQGGEAPVHGRVGRETGFDREDVRREIGKTFGNRIEAGLRAQGREPGRPDVRGDEKGVWRGCQRDLQKVARIHAQDGASVGFDVADAGQARRHARRGLEVGRVDEIVHLAHPITAAVDAADLDRQHETHRRATGRRNLGVHGPGQFFAQGKETVAR